MIRRKLPLLAILLLVGGNVALAAETILSEHGSINAETVASGLDHPWGMVFLPDGSMLVTERSGNLRRVSATGGISTPISGLPAVDVRGQGGLLDIVLAPDFANSQQIFFSYSEPGTDAKDKHLNSTAVASATIQGETLTNVKVIFRQMPKYDSRHHFGSRLVFDRQGKLFITTGDRNSQRQQVQKLDNGIGKVLRINVDGSVPADNPFVDQANTQTEIWSFGHRNIQGATLHPITGELWTHEHGPQGGDEINITLPGKNYGWPLITYGEEYGGGTIGKTSADGLEQPFHYWVPSIAPSGMTFYTASLFGDWQNNLLVGSLKFGQLVRLELTNNKVSHEERIMIGQRVRDVTQGPDGAIYLLTDSDDGQILRLTPAK